LFRKNYDNVFLRCLEKYDADKVLAQLHDGPAGGHFGGETTTHKILRVGYFWPTLFRDAYAYARKCKLCQTTLEEKRNLIFHCNPVEVEGPFEQWGLDIIREINPNSTQLHKYIMTTTNYFTCWTKAIPLKKVNEEQVISFLNQFIISRFGIPNSLVFDNASYFSSLKLTEFALEKGITVKYSANYYPQGNGLA
jgi:hypothetical protein